MKRKLEHISSSSINFRKNTQLVMQRLFIELGVSRGKINGNVLESSRNDKYHRNTDRSCRAAEDDIEFRCLSSGHPLPVFRASLKR